MTYMPTTIFGSQVTRQGKDYARMDYKGTSYEAIYEAPLGAYFCRSRTPVEVNGRAKLMQLQHQFSDSEVEDFKGDGGYDALSSVLLRGIRRLEPQIEYRKREIAGEDMLPYDPVIDGAIELEKLAQESAERESLEAHESWGAWG